MSDPCPFCTLPPERIIEQTPLALVIRDGFPVSPGHTLILPRRHVGSFFETIAEERIDLLRLLDRAQTQLTAQLRPAGFNVSRGQIAIRFISITGELTELTTLFTGYWRCLMPATQTSSIAFPFSRLNSEPFWELVPLRERQITREAINNISTVSQLRQLVLGANLDEELFFFMTQAESRTSLTEALLQACFSEEGRRILRDEIGIQQQAFRYSQELEVRAHHQIKEAELEVVYSDTVRDQGFRRAVVQCYDHRCALCGVRIITPEGHAVVEAAHIKPWSRFKDDKDDEVQNGMALCRLCHWAFDEGLMSVDDNYNVLTSRQMAMAPNAAGFLMTLSGRPIIRPQDTALWPDPARLWHRRNVGVGF